MSSLLANWKTSLAGVLLVVMGALNTFLGIHVPGFSMDFVTALTAGIGLIVAKDSNVTGGTTPQ